MWRRGKKSVYLIQSYSLPFCLPLLVKSAKWSAIKILCVRNRSAPKPISSKTQTHQRLSLLPHLHESPVSFRLSFLPPLRHACCAWYRNTKTTCISRSGKCHSVGLLAFDFPEPWKWSHGRLLTSLHGFTVRFFLSGTRIVHVCPISSSSFF